MAVPDGDGIAQIWAALIESTTLGSGYSWKTHIRPRGTTWRESVHGLSFLPFQVIEEPVNEINLSSEGWPLLDTVKFVEVLVQYNALEAADLSVMLVRGDNPAMDDTTFRVETGSASLDLALHFPSDPVPGDDYMLIARLIKADADSLMASDTLQNLEILETEDPVGFSHPGAARPGTIKAYPNPAYGSMTVHIPDSFRQVESVSISDFSGRILLQLKDDLNGHREEGIVVDISSLQTGYYILNCKADNSNYTTSFIVN